jgi:alkylation response protein AidB-like acyl-CoA dehydrogenase
MRDSIIKIVERDIYPILNSFPRDKELPKEVLKNFLKHFCKMGLTNVRLPESAGGPGISMTDYGVIFEQIPPVIAVALMAHEGSISRLYAEGSEEQKIRLLPALISGEKIFCTGSTEPDVGSDPRGIKTRLIKNSNGLYLSGRKMWVSNINVCDAILVTCLDCRQDKNSKKVIKVFIDREQSPFVTNNIETIGFKQGWLGEALFDECPIDPRNVIDSPAGGTDILKASWAVNRPIFSLSAVHLAQLAFNVALDYSKIRYQFSKSIASHQLVQKNLADVETAIVSSRLMCFYSLSLYDRGIPKEGAAAMAKRYTQNACQDAIWQCMNILGAMGLSVDSKLEEWYRDVRMIAVGDGTNEILALIQGRDISGISAFRNVA